MARHTTFGKDVVHGVRGVTVRAFNSAFHAGYVGPVGATFVRVVSAFPKEGLDDRTEITMKNAFPEFLGGYFRAKVSGGVIHKGRCHHGGC